MAACACALMIAALWTLAQGYPPGEAALRALDGDDDVRVAFDSDVWRFDGPGDGAALIFYPGGLVDARAYAPLLRAIAEGGVDCFMPEMPMKLALLKRNAAAAVMAQCDCDRWFVGGHSLGGVAASMFAAAHPEGTEGLVLLAAYPDSALPEGLRLLSIRGTNDGVLNREKYERARAYWPADAMEVAIEGGNHANFGDYGAQRGDREAEITPGEQRTRAVSAILEFCGAGI